MIKGKVKLVFRDIHTGEITKTHEQENEITESQLATFISFTSTTSNQTFGRYVSIGTWEQPTNRGWNRLYDVTKFGYVESGVNSPLFINPGSPNNPYIQYQNRFDPPTGVASRTIHTVGVQYDESASTTVNERRWESAGAYIGLTSPCTQTDTETLDVFYRLIFDVAQADGMSWSQVYYLAGRMAHANTVNRPWVSVAPYYNHTYMSGKIDPTTRLNQNWFAHARRNCGSGNSNLGGTYLTFGRYRARIQQTTLALTQYLGRIIGTIGYSTLRGTDIYNDPELFHSKLLKDGDSPIGNVFGHSPAATGPFYSSSTANTGDGTINLDGSAWTNPDFPYLYRLDVETSGGVGVGEYRFRRRKTIGFINNTYYNDHVAIPFINGRNYAGLGNMFEGEENLTAGYGPCGIKWIDATNMVVFDKTWVGIIDVMTGVSQRWNGETGSPATLFTNTRQVHVAPDGDIWVADNTGVYRIDPIGGSSVVFNPTNTAQLATLTGDVCYGVTSTAGGKIWAVFGGGMASTTDDGANWTVYTSANFNGDNSRVFGINGDPTHADDRIAALYHVDVSGNRDIDIHWWDRVSDAVSANRIDRFWYEPINGNNPSYPRECFQMFTCSPNDGIWGTAYDDGVDGAALYNWDSTTPFQSQVRPADHRHAAYRSFSWEQATDGQDALVYFAYNSSNARMYMLEQDGTHSPSSLVETTANLSSSHGIYTDYWGSSSGYGMRAWLPGGVVVWNTKGNFTSGDIKNWLLGMYGIDNNGLSGAFERVHWETYGWNGSAWELDNPNGRPFHSSYEELADGVTVAFNVAGGSPEGTFVAGEYYTVAVVDGIMADGATTFDHRHVYYMKPAVFNVTDFETATLPAAPQTMLAGLSTGTRVNDSGAYSAGLTWTDTAGNKSFSSTQITNGSLIGGGRTNNEIPAGEDGDVYFTMYSGSGFDNSTAGLSDVAKRGTAINRDTIDYGFRWNVGLGSQSWEVQIVENGVVVATIDDGDSVYFSDDPSGTGSAMDRSNEQYISHRIKRVGTTIEYYWREKLVHTSTVPSSTALCFDAWLAQYIGIAYVSINYPFTDYIGEFGNSTLQTGKFDPDFFQIVSMGESQPTVLIGGVQGTHIGFNDYTTALAAGEYSILTNGYLRYSAADAGKTIAVDYTYLKHV